MGYIGKTKLPPDHPLAHTTSTFGARRPPGSAAPAPTSDDVNRPEIEADGYRAGALRIAKAKHQSKAFRDQSRGGTNKE